MTPVYKSVAHADWGSQTLTLPRIPDLAEWENKFESVPGVSRIEEGDFGRLRQLLSACEDQDSYLTSPAYYSFTGRQGLWAYEKDDAFLLVCWHPNVAGQVLIFPPLVKPEANLAAELLGVIPAPSAGIRLARIKANQIGDLKDVHFETRHVSLERKTEEVLDWKYPVHILSTDKVASLSGHKFMKIRNHIRQLKKHKVDVQPFNAIDHSRALENLLHRWANLNAENKAEYDLLYAPYEALFSHSLDKPSGLSGQLIFVDGQLQAVGLWDVSNTSQPTANVYVNFCNIGIRGLSEFSMAQCCETLRDAGVRYINLGGSETESLDSYKRKFDPAISIDLCSIEAKISDDRVNVPRRTTDPSLRHQGLRGSSVNV